MKKMIISECSKRCHSMKNCLWFSYDANLMGEDSTCYFFKSCMSVIEQTNFEFYSSQGGCDDDHLYRNFGRSNVECRKQCFWHSNRLNSVTHAPKFPWIGQEQYGIQ